MLRAHPCIRRARAVRWGRRSCRYRLPSRTKLLSHEPQGGDSPRLDARRGYDYDGACDSNVAASPQAGATAKSGRAKRAHLSSCPSCEGRWVSREAWT